MVNRRWWDAAVAAASFAVIVATVVGFSAAPASDAVIASAALVLFVATYLFVARPGLAVTRPWHLPVFVGGATVALAAGCASEPFFAIMQAIAYPLTWVLTASKRRAVVGSIIVAMGVFVGFALFEGGVDEGDSLLPALIGAAATAGFGLVFAIAFGLWIARIIEYGQERAQLVAELTAAQSEVEALSRDRGALEERERFARDIHDTLAQTLAGLTILAERAGRQLAEGRADASAESIATVERLARDALEEARALVARSAAVPADSALADAVERLVDRFRAEVGLTIDLELNAKAAIPRDSQLVVLRCLQEALANVRKHARATRVRVRVETDAGGLARLEVVDDGTGFEPDARRSGFGLDGMSERVALAGGVLEIHSHTGGGTTIAVELPAAHADATTS